MLPKLAPASGKPVWHVFGLWAGGFQDEDVYPEALRHFASGSGLSVAYIGAKDSQLRQGQVGFVAWHDC